MASYRRKERPTHRETLSGHQKPKEDNYQSGLLSEGMTERMVEGMTERIN